MSVGGEDHESSAKCWLDEDRVQGDSTDDPD